MCVLCSFRICDIVLFPGTGNLLAHLSTNFNRCNINKLCMTVDQKCVVHCFPEAAPLEPIMNQFWIMTHECESKIFSKYWHDRLVLIIRSRSSGLELSDIAEEVWSPVFDKCVKLLAELKDYSISLMTVNQLFEGQPISTITFSIKQLYKGVELCQKGREVSNFKWIQGVVERMMQFWQLHGFTAAAQTFLEIRDVLKLTGDFKLVENVASRVRHTCRLCLPVGVVSALLFLLLLLLFMLSRLSIQ